MSMSGSEGDSRGVSEEVSQERNGLSPTVCAHYNTYVGDSSFDMPD
jgi:hypothetical protein